MNFGDSAIRALMAPLVLLAAGCEGWEIFQSEDTALGSEPYILSVLNAETCPLPKGLDPKNVTILSYNVRLRGQHVHKVPANYFYASLLTSDGARYLADFPGCSPILSSPPVAQGETAEGYLNFPIPPGKTPEKLVYAPSLTGKPTGETLVEIALGEPPSSETREGDSP